MRFLEVERETLNRFLPGLDECIGAADLRKLEQPDSDAISLFRDSGGAGLMIPQEYGGLGATLLDAIRVQRAIGSRAPSLAVASTMHHFSVATLVEVCAALPGLEWMVLEGIAKQRLLVASGFAEGRSGRRLFDPMMEARKTPDGYIVNGSKKPCSLSRSMDLLTASVRLVASDADGPAVALIPADSPGIERRPFWNSLVLTGAESDEVVLKDVSVPHRLVYPSSGSTSLGRAERIGFVSFELLISASYLGIASGLVERVLENARTAATDRAVVGIEVEGAMAALERVAGSIRDDADSSLVAKALFVRYAVQASVERASMRSAEALGGIAYISSPDVGYLLASSRALAFHPPPRGRGEPALNEYLSGREFQSD